jgi:acetyltransferase-like isoleucine patch superfamily enzyme
LPEPHTRGRREGIDEDSRREVKMSDPYRSHPTAEVSEEAEIGEGTRIWHQAQVREGARIGKNCVLGKCAYVGIDVQIGDGVKIENRASVFKGVTIEDDVFVGPHVVFTNDKYPRSFSEEWKVVPTHVEKGASVGANSTVICGVTIGRYAMVAAGSVVTRDVPPHSLVVGNPARERAYVCRCGRSIATVERAREMAEGEAIECKECGFSNIINPGPTPRKG